MKYIDADKLKAEIERRMTENYELAEKADEAFGQRAVEDNDILALIASLRQEQPEVDLEKETEESEKPINPDDAMEELNEKIALVKQKGTWDGVDVDKYMDEVRGREPEKPVPADLEEAVEKQINEALFKWSYDDEDGIEQYVHDAFIAGAKWQKQHDAELIEIAYNDGITIGMTKQKEQMMEDAVEGTVYGNGEYTWVAGDIPSQFKYGDKVRVIVLPKED